MAVYKVPQDVEADDKLIGPLSFRQFMYLIIAAIAGFIAWLMWSITPFMVVLPLPIIIFFVILALPLRKDQPMEIYLIAVAQFLLKPKKRLWDPDGTIALVQITAPKSVEPIRTKDLSEREAVSRLSYLAQVMDTHGWASRDTSITPSVSDDVAIEAEQTQDVMDTDTNVSRSLNTLIDQRNTSYRKDLMDRLQKQPAKPSGPSSQIPRIPANPYTEFTSHAPENQSVETPQNIQYQPYPTMHQQVIQPAGQTPAEPPQQPQATPPQPPQPPEEPAQNASANEVSPDIINLASNQDLSISTIANEAHRREKSKNSDDEVVISLH